jgi:HAE1 family hydrophobic/amphiphilic exporter-1
VRAAGDFLLRDFFVVVLTDLRRLYRFVSRGLNRLFNPLLDPVQHGFENMHDAYRRLLTWSLDHKFAVFGLTGALSAVAVVLVFGLGAELIPPVTQGEFYFEVRLPEGTPLQQTDALFKGIETEVAAFNGVKTVFSGVGGSNKNQFARRVLEENVGQLYVVMADRQDKAAEQAAIDQVRQRLGRVPEAIFSFQRPTFFSIKTPVEVEIFGFDLESLRRTADLVAGRMENINGLSDIQTSTQLGNPEVQIRFDRERLARLGLDEGRVSSVVRSKIRGDVASRFREEDRQIEILVRAGRADRTTIDNIRDLIVNAGGPETAARSVDPRVDDIGRIDAPPLQTARPAQPANARRQSPRQTAAAPLPIRLGAVADVTVARGPSEVRRIRAQRAAVVSANLSGRDLASVTADIRTELQRLRSQLPPEVSLGIGGQNEEMITSQRSLQLALALAVFLVYLVMASQFESLVHPLIILFSIPLGLVGVVYALFLTGTTISVVVFLGVIILAGIVVNNAIILLDYTNQLREQGLDIRKALCEAGTTRLRPILMTTLTTVLGLIPMAVGWGEGAEIRAPMAITVIGGLSLSTLLTLVFIPVVYELVAGRRRVPDTAHASEQAVPPLSVPHAGD